MYLYEFIDQFDSDSIVKFAKEDICMTMGQLRDINYLLQTKIEDLHFCPDVDYGYGCGGSEFGVLCIENMESDE